MAANYPYSGSQQQDSRTFAANTRPAKINLISEQPRRDSLVEERFNNQFNPNNYPDYQPQSGYNYQSSSATNQLRSHQQPLYSSSGGGEFSGHQSNSYSRPTGSTRTVTTTTVKTTTLSSNAQQQQQQQQQQHQQQQQQQQQADLTDLSALERELAEKEARLKRELAYLNQYHNQWSRPKQVREPRREPAKAPAKLGWVKECPVSSRPGSRPTSRASSTRSTTTEADLLEKAAKLLQDVEEFERKPLNKQQLFIENGARGPPKVIGSSNQEHISDVHTAFITVDRNEVDNKSPLPFAYDNFSTLGVRGNIASVGAAPPEKPYAPIFPTIKRTPSPTRGNRRY